jgi:hypothetical protein
MLQPWFIPAIEGSDTIKSGRNPDSDRFLERANEEDAVVKWDYNGRMRLHQPSLKKI